ncbi:nitrilase-related carbon-nitrogen hydrolase [Patulibacter defluvii]|uniref:nitrilase-related carbon-nitrogen hydrolase n=1 Tax=Patulibacter defluvii TaxID=3095358 RepID=UPI002A763562|nr:nitrilase-related carbon-nitrogen hydrolase [Patulibacter sp. DM4]
MELLVAPEIPASPARTRPPERRPLRVGAVQLAWDPDPAAHRAALERGIRTAAEAGAEVVFLQELTLSPYFAVTRDPQPQRAEPLPGGPTSEFATRVAAEVGIHVHASLYERAEDGGLGFNTAILAAPSGELVGRTRKLHIPVTAGYYEDHHFRPGPAGEDALPVYGVGEARVGLPTCWDQWFPELARGYALAGADLVAYPTAIGSEPDHPEFDTEPLWRQSMIGHAIANGLFVVAVNRTGAEGELTFYGSSFIADPYGRVLVRAPRDRPAVLVADLDLDQRRDWQELFPFLGTRRPDAYGSLVAPVAG